jgi:hypothetical protein
MQAFLDDPEAAAREAAVRLAHIRAGFSVSRMTTRIEALYREALGKRRGARQFAPSRSAPITR